MSYYNRIYKDKMSKDRTSYLHNSKQYPNQFVLMLNNRQAYITAKLYEPSFGTMSLSHRLVSKD